MTPAPAPATPRTLAGATILQIVPALRDDPTAHAAVEIALTLLQAGARAIIAGEGGSLVGELRAFGGEWLPMKVDTLNPIQLKRNAAMLQQLIPTQRIDIVHAHSAAAAWCALAGSDRMPVWLVTSFADRLTGSSWWGTRYHASLARGDRVIAPSAFVSQAMIERYKIAPERITVIPRAIDTARFAPTAVMPQQVLALRRAWGILPDLAVVLLPGRLAPWNGQTTLIEAARLISGAGDRNVVYVLAGDDRSHPRHVRALRRKMRALGVDTLFRVVGHVGDMPTALAVADVIVVPPSEPPLTGRAAAEAQAMGKPTIISAVGVLPENILQPPRMPDDLRTGWMVRPNNPAEMARAVAKALAMSEPARAAFSARARQFAEFMFSPQSVAEAIRSVYTSLLSRQS
ncbi:MAG TPA: glycosyltransferase [Pseudolabrys sp.]|nr:glycosyltransferase [Pseudolabrys sp.]